MARRYPLQVRETAIKKALTGHDSTRQIAEQMGVGLSSHLPIFWLIFYKANMYT